MTNLIEIHRKVMEDYVTDEMLTKPVSELTVVESSVLQSIFRGPLGDELIERIDNLNDRKE